MCTYYSVRGFQHLEIKTLIIFQLILTCQGIYLWAISTIVYEKYHQLTFQYPLQLLDSPSQSSTNLDSSTYFSANTSVGETKTYTSSSYTSSDFSYASALLKSDTGKNNTSSTSQNWVKYKTSSLNQLWVKYKTSSVSCG